MSKDKPHPMVISTDEGDLHAWLCVCGAVVAVGFAGHFETCQTAIADREIDALLEPTATPLEEDDE